MHISDVKNSNKAFYQIMKNWKCWGSFGLKQRLVQNENWRVCFFK